MQALSLGASTRHDNAATSRAANTALERTLAVGDLHHLLAAILATKQSASAAGARSRPASISSWNPARPPPSRRQLRDHFRKARHVIEDDKTLVTQARSAPSAHVVDHAAGDPTHRRRRSRIGSRGRACSSLARPRRQFRRPCCRRTRRHPADKRAQVLAAEARAVVQRGVVAEFRDALRRPCHRSPVIPTTRQPARRASWPTRLPTAPAAVDTSTVSPGCGRPISYSAR